MRKLLLAMAVLGCFSISTFAQVDRLDTVNVDVKSGIKKTRETKAVIQFEKASDQRKSSNSNDKSDLSRIRKYNRKALLKNQK